MTPAQARVCEAWLTSPEGPPPEHDSGDTRTQNAAPATHAAPETPAQAATPAPPPPRDNPPVHEGGGGGLGPPPTGGFPGEEN